MFVRKKEAEKLKGRIAVLEQQNEWLTSAMKSLLLKETKFAVGDKVKCAHPMHTVSIFGIISSIFISEEFTVEYRVTTKDGFDYNVHPNLITKIGKNVCEPKEKK